MSRNDPAPIARPTLRDVAARAGVSFKTVSRVINGEPSVRPATAERVMRAVRELGYQPNVNASSLKRGVAQDTIGLLIEDVSNPFFATVARAVEEVTRERGLLLIIASSDEDRSRERSVIDSLVSRRVRGLIVVPIGRDHRYLAREMALGTAFVFLDRPPGQLDADTVLVDNAAGARMAVDHLVAHGHRRIGILTDKLEVYTMAERFSGYRTALDRAGIQFDPVLVRHDCHDPAAAYAAADAMLRSDHPPTAFFTTNNLLTAGTVGAIGTVRPDTAIVGFDDFALASSLATPVTVMKGDHERLGQLSAELLLRRLDGWDGEPETISLPMRLVPRGSGEIHPSNGMSATHIDDVGTVPRVGARYEAPLATPEADEPDEADRRDTPIPPTARATATIGLLLEDVSNPYSGAVHRAIGDAAAQRGFATLATSLDEDPEREREGARAMIERQVDGLVIMPTGSDQSYLLDEMSRGLAVVFIDRPPSLLEADTVVATNRDGAREAVEHLMQRGHRRVAFLGDLRAIATARERYQGYVDALRSAELPLDERLVRTDLHTRDAAEAAAHHLLDLPPGVAPTALFSSQNLVTIDTVRTLRERGLQHHIALVGFDDIELADMLDPGITVVAQDPFRIGIEAAELLFARLDGHTGPSQRRQVSTRLLERGSGEIAPPVEGQTSPAPSHAGSEAP